MDIINKTQYQFNFGGLADFCDNNHQENDNNNNLVTYVSMAAGSGSAATLPQSNFWDQGHTERVKSDINNSYNPNENNNSDNLQDDENTQNSPHLYCTSGTGLTLEFIQSQFTLFQSSVTSQIESMTSIMETMAEENKNAQNEREKE